MSVVHARDSALRATMGTTVKKNVQRASLESTVSCHVPVMEHPVTRLPENAFVLLGKLDLLVRKIAQKVMGE